jgi:glycosyltransferase involved in cell wall biosynthesis
MRVMQVITAFQLGGAESIAANLAIGLTERGHDVLVATVRRPATGDRVGLGLKARLLGAGVAIRELSTGLNVPDLVVCPHRVASLYSDWNADLVHSHTDIPDLMVSLAKRRQPDMRIARTIQNTVLWPTHRRLGRLTESGLHDDMVIVTNDATRQAYSDLRRRYSLPISRLGCVIKNGFIPGSDEIACTRPALIARYSAHPEKYLFCFAGRLTRQKGIDILLDALGELDEDILAKAELHIFGDGEERLIITERIQALNLPVVLHPAEPLVYRLFPAFDCMVVPSRYEGLPMVVIESLCQGLPVIVTASPGLIDAVPTWWPLVAPKGDSRGLGDLMKDAIEGSIEIEQLGSRGREWAIEEYALDTMIGRHEDAYAKLLGAP